MSNRGLRIRRGLPRGGIGYAAIPLAVVALIVAWKAPGSTAYLVPAGALPLCVWFGLGLQRDDRAGEATDILAVDDDQWGAWPLWQGVWRLSTLSIVVTAIAIVVGALR